MSGRTLHNCRILVVEDEYYFAQELRAELNEVGAIVLGPTATLEDALEVIQLEDQIDGAILDLNLGGEAAYPIADLLVDRRVPIVFSTGYDQSEIPAHFAKVKRCEKPIDLSNVIQAMGQAISRIS